ncbi:MAG: site-specific integrase, partial [Gammaproteobacteria bacterium]|nr:site-specific integrase [Gammaproteobacteria bacterium]
MVAHLKTFSKWIHKLRAFPLGNPTGKIKSLAIEGILDLERALTESERRKLLDAADHLPVIGGRSKDRRRNKKTEFPDERPRRKGYRPWRNRAIVYALVETGMRRAEVTSIDLGGIDFQRKTLLITEKGGQQRKCL